VSIGTKYLLSWIDLLPMAVITYRYSCESFPWIHWMLGGLLVLFGVVAKIKTICGFNHTVVHYSTCGIYMVSITHPLVAAAVACILVHCEGVPCVSNAD